MEWSWWSFLGGVIVGAIIIISIVVYLGNMFKSG